MATPTTPQRPTHNGHTTSGAAGQGHAPTQKSLEHHLATIAECEVMDPQGLYEFLESVRAVTSGLAFFVHTASTQLESAARKGAKDSTDGRMTLRQKVELAKVLRRMGRQLSRGTAEDLLSAATSVVKTYALMQEFLDNLESDNVQRPHRSNRGGFSLGGR